MKTQILTALLCLSTITITACDNQRKVTTQTHTAEPSKEVKKNLEIYESNISLNNKFTDLVNATFNRDPNIYFSQLHDDNVYDQIAVGCIKSGDLTFSEIIPEQLYKFEPSEKLKECIVAQGEKPISYKTLARSFLVVVPPNDHEKASAKKANEEISKILEQADIDGKLSINAYFDAVSILHEEKERSREQVLTTSEK